MEQTFKKFVTQEGHDIAMNVSQIVAIEELEYGFQNHKYFAIVILNSNIKIAIEGDLDDTLEVLGVKL